MVDELTDPSFVNWGSSCPPGDGCRGWFARPDRPVGQILEIAAINGNTVSFSTPLHIGFRMAHGAQLFWGELAYGAKHAGVEDLYVHGGLDDNVLMRYAKYSWIKNVESEWSTGNSFAIDYCFRCVLRDSYAHDTPNPTPGGGGYMLSMAWHTSDTLVENNIFMHGNKVMVMRATGGGNVIAYNYFDDGFIDFQTDWMETGINPSHMTCPHYELFEGNQAFNIDADNTWGGTYANTFFRNHATGKRRSFPDVGNRRAIGLMTYHYDYSFVGNVLGTEDQDPAPFAAFEYEDVFPWNDDPVGLWRIGYNPEDWNAPPDARVVASVHRHGNFDYVTKSVQWAAGFDQRLPDSLYLTQRPAFFGRRRWPWVEPNGFLVKLHSLPARERFEATIPVRRGRLEGASEHAARERPAPGSLSPLRPHLALPRRGGVHAPHAGQRRRADGAARASGSSSTTARPTPRRRSWPDTRRSCPTCGSCADPTAAAAASAPA